VSTEPTEVAPGIHRFTDALANWYAIGADGGVVLVDCGWPRSTGALVAGLQAIGRTPADVAAVLLTHGHEDHLGTAAWLAEEHGVPVYAHRDELPRVRGERRPTWGAGLVRELWRPSAVRFVATCVRKGVSSPRWVNDPSVLPEAERAAVPAGARVIPVPGHTEGHVAYHLPDRGVVVCGDALVTLSVLTRRPGPQLHPSAFALDNEQAARSLPVLATLDADLLLPGHGEPYAGSPQRAVEEALEP
jgi:glyoxylase-like metal-dependent hydrolase (beta-lactamase superfamily II)